MMIGLFFKMLGIIAFWELILQLIFKVSLFRKGKRELYVYIIGAVLFTLTVLFVKQHLDVPQIIFNYASLFFAVGIAGCDVITSKYIESKKKRFGTNLVFMIAFCALTYLLLPVIYPFI